MFELHPYLRHKGTPIYIVWAHAFHPKKIQLLATKEQIMKFDIKSFCEEFYNRLPTPSHLEKETHEKFSVYLTGNMLLGLVRVFDYQAEQMLINAQRVVERVNQPWDIIPLDDSSISPIRQAQDDIALEDPSVSPVHQPRALTPVDFDFDDPMESVRRRDSSVRRDVLGDVDQANLLENDQPMEEEPAVDEEQQQPRRRAPRKRARRADDSDDENDDDYGRRAKPRRRKARDNVVRNIARHETITMQEDNAAPLVDFRASLENDLYNDLEPLDEATLPPPQMFLRRTASPEDARKDSGRPSLFDRPDFDDIDHTGLRSPARTRSNESSTDRLAINTLQSPQRLAVLTRSPVDVSAQAIFNFDASPRGTPALQDQAFFNFGASRPVTPVAPQPFYDNDFDDIPPAVHPRTPSTSPAREIAVSMFRSPTPSFPVPINSRDGTPVQAILNFDASRSVTPAPQPQPDNDFDYNPNQENDGSVFKVPRQKRPRRKNAREPPISLENDVFLNRDQVYLQKNLREPKFTKIAAQFDDIKNYYKKLLDEDAAAAIPIDNHEDTPVQNVDLINNREETPARSVEPSRPVTPAPDQPFYDNDFDYPDQNQDVPRAVLSRTGTPLQNPMPSFAALSTPVKSRSRTPMPDYHVIQYDDPVPLPAELSGLISPPRPQPAEFFTSDQSSLKSVSCGYDHDALYMLLVCRSFQERKVVFKFSDFAREWPRSYIAKQFHNFLLLIQLRKIVARCENGIFHSFILVPNDEFKMNIAKVAVHRARIAA